jgi:hypothetical protein
MYETDRGSRIAEKHITQLRIITGKAIQDMWQVRATLSCGNEVVLLSCKEEDEAKKYFKKIESVIDSL